MSSITRILMRLRYYIDLKLSKDIRNKYFVKYEADIHNVNKEFITKIAVQTRFALWQPE